jgi:hypothetical protein
LPAKSEALQSDHPEAALLIAAAALLIAIALPALRVNREEVIGGRARGAIALIFYCGNT